MSIILQSSVSFSAEFMREVPMLEKAMIAHGLEPSKFVISKDFRLPVDAVMSSARSSYDYTVFVDGEHFTLTEPNDMVFLDYFLKLCTAEDDVRPLLKLRRGRRRPGPPLPALDGEAGLINEQSIKPGI